MFSHNVFGVIIFGAAREAQNKLMCANTKIVSGRRKTEKNKFSKTLAEARWTAAGSS